MPERERERGGLKATYIKLIYDHDHEISALKSHLFGVMTTLREIFEKVCRS